uniref:Biopterin-dependent aromatic amino acid hydroxylase family profile domain-containing protein n=1 Tax=Arundo donax TaxID=35708 RepID=A0A0A8Z6A6_ARUDO
MPTYLYFTIQFALFEVADTELAL